jgi:hypothetical protein
MLYAILIDVKAKNAPNAERVCDGAMFFICSVAKSSPCGVDLSHLGANVA